MDFTRNCEMTSLDFISFELAKIQFGTSCLQLFSTQEMRHLDRLCKLLILPLSFIIGPYTLFNIRSYADLGMICIDLSHHDLRNIYIYIYFKLFFCFKCTPLPFVPPKPIPFLRGATKKKHHGATKEWMQLMSASPRGDRFRNEARTKAQLLWLRQQPLGTKPLRSSNSWKNHPFVFCLFLPCKGLKGSDIC